jgi:hypothetical protein
VRAVTGIERYLAVVASSSSTLIRIYLTDIRLSAHLVMALYLGAAGHRSCKEREIVKLIRHASSPRSGTELSQMNGCKKMQARQRVESPLWIDCPRPRLEEVESDVWGPMDRPKSEAEPNV